MKNKRLIIIFVTVFMDLVGFGIIIPMNPYLAKAFGASPFEVGLLMGIYSLMQFVFAPIWGQLSDRIGRRPVIIVSLLGAAAAHLGFALSTTFWGLVLARALAGLFGGNISTAMAYIADITEAKDRTKGMGLIGAAFGLGFIFGPVLGGVFSQVGVSLGSQPPLGESFPAVVAAAICFLNALFAIRFLPESRTPTSAPVAEKYRRRFHNLVRALSTPVLGVLMLLVFLNTLAMAQIEASLFLMVQDERGWTLAQASFGFAYIGLIMVFTQGYLIRKVLGAMGEKRILAAGMALSALGYGMIALSSPLLLLAVGVTLLALGNGLVNPSLMGSVSLASGQDVQGHNLGVSQSLSSLARILGPPMGGWLYQLNHPIPFLAASLIAVIALVLIFVWRSILPERGRES